jgi:uncharacterized membrane protein YfcA
MSPPSYVLLALVAFVASVLNVLAGGGSFLTLPVLLFLGLPAVEANATNRVGVVAQNLASVWGFHRQSVLDWRWAFASAAPASLGAVIGAWLALHVHDRDFRRILAVAMVAVTLWTLADPRDRIRPAGGRSPWSPSVLAGFLVVGFYGGFVQAGVGFLVLAVTTFAGMDLVRGNAVKVLNVLLLTVLSLGVFVLGGHVDWPAGLALAAGSLAGGLAGVPLAVLAGHRFLRPIVSATVIVFAVLLWIT